jgi:geranylgeranyl diphosphate synthase, type II
MHTVEDLHQLFIQKLEKENFSHEPKELYEPFNYMLSLGGKRMRPLLTLMACNLFDGNIVQALDGAMAIELFHNFTLVHDDIMDKAPIRRGLPTVHIKYNSNVALLSGDVMLVYAYKFLDRLDNSILKKCLTQFNTTAVKVCEGQQLDLNFETQEQVTMEDYLHMIELKTAVLPAFALHLGTIIAGASEKESLQLYQFGINIGMAFQLQDDILDSFGNEKVFGKKNGGDIAQNKKTILLIRALEVADVPIKKELEKWYTSTASNSGEKISMTKKIFSELKVKDFAIEKMEAYHKTAISYLTKLSVSDSKKEILKNFAETLLYRTI